MRTLSVLNTQELTDILSACRTCFVALIDGNSPYVIPMNFGYDGEYIILHSGKEGRKWDALNTNPKVCITWMLGDEIVSQNEQVGCSYRVKSKTLMLEGELEFVDDYEEKLKCLNAFMKQYSNKQFQFNRPAVENVGIMRIKSDDLVGKEFGAKPPQPWKSGK
ncbi:MAG: pyridoxamine 5'-phosphate oxidase family protein [Mangrovibacterium sp.]